MTGIAFRYLSIWKAASPNNQNGYLPPAISDSSLVEMREMVFFSPDGNPYEKTNLQQLSFAFGVAHVGSAAACSSLVAENQERTGPVRTASRGDQIFTEIQGGDAAMSHRLQFTLDSTWHSGECLVFEQDEATIAPYVQEGKRVLSVRKKLHCSATFMQCLSPLASQSDHIPLVPITQANVQTDSILSLGATKI